MARRPSFTLRLYWLILLAVVVVGSLLPPSSAPVTLMDRLHADKALHFGFYAVLAFLPMLHEDRRQGGICLLTAMLLGFTLENLQTLTGRTVEAADILANTWGIAVGALLGFWVGLRTARSRAIGLRK